MSRKITYFYDPDVGNFHYGKLNKVIFSFLVTEYTFTIRIMYMYSVTCIYMYT